jgi:hypothetical protein
MQAMMHCRTEERVQQQNGAIAGAYAACLGRCAVHQMIRFHPAMFVLPMKRIRLRP